MAIAARSLQYWTACGGSSTKNAELRAPNSGAAKVRETSACLPARPPAHPPTFYLVKLCQVSSVNCLIAEDAVDRKVLGGAEALLQ
jgi:hypothetical protein